MASILSKAGVNPGMSFKCCDCGDQITGQRVIDGDYLYIVAANREIPEASVFRCECCQDEWEERRLRVSNNQPKAGGTMLPASSSTNQQTKKVNESYLYICQ